jgi:hypothetical protein
MATQYAFGKIVTDGLVLALDAADKNSYPGSGTTWTDISGNNITGSLINSPTFNTSNGGNFGFVTDDYVIMEENSALNTQTPSVEVWIKTNATNQNGFWFEKGQANTQYSLFQEDTRTDDGIIVWRQNLTTVFASSQSTTTATYLNTTNWAQVVGTFISGDRRTYINGILRTSDAQTGIITTNTNGMSIGVYGGFNGGRGYFYNGNIAIVRVYNKALSASEVAQNYNAQKSRFNL